MIEMKPFAMFFNPLGQNNMVFAGLEMSNLFKSIKPDKTDSSFICHQALRELCTLLDLTVSSSLKEAFLAMNVKRRLSGDRLRHGKSREHRAQYLLHIQISEL